MVDQVGGKPFSVADRIVGRVERLGAARAAETTRRTAPDPAATGGFGQVARDLAAGPPVDIDRVARIRRAVQEGRFPISPSTIADRLLALKMNWNGNDPS